MLLFLIFEQTESPRHLIIRSLISDLSINYYVIKSWSPCLMLIQVSTPTQNI